MNREEIRTVGGGGQELNRTDVALAAALFIAALALRIPFRSQMAYHWDSAQLALAVGEYNIRLNQPHPPGFYFYIFLARWLNIFVGEPHTALVWLSVIAGSWLAAMGYLLATSMFGRGCGRATGLILLTSPLCWFHSEIALTTIVDGALVVTFVFVCWRAIQRKVTWWQTFAMAAAFAAVGGVRQQSGPLLIPLWIYVFWTFARPRLAKLLCGTALAAGFCLLWFLPMVKSAGGLGSYLGLVHLKNQIDASRTLWGGGGAAALLTDVQSMGQACWAGLLVAGIVAAAEFIRWVFFREPIVRRSFYQANKAQFAVLALWTTPMFLFGLIMYSIMPGHVLHFFPALAVLAGLGVAAFSKQLASWPIFREPRAEGVVLTVLVSINVLIFVYSPPTIMPVLLGLPMTGVEIRQHDANLSACLWAIRGKWLPGSVVICHRFENFYWGYAQFKYYLPEYQNVLVWNAPPPALPAADILLVVPPGESLDLFRPIFDLRSAVLVAEDGVKLYVVRGYRSTDSR
jgi:hypothetical protein